MKKIFIGKEGETNYLFESRKVEKPFLMGEALQRYEDIVQVEKVNKSSEQSSKQKLGVCGQKNAVVSYLLLPLMIVYFRSW